MSPRRIHPFSLIIFLVFAGTVLTVNILRPPKSILTYDTFGYYLYLPGAFIYHQLEFSDLSKLEKLNEQYKYTSTFYQFVRAPNMKYLDKYTMGLAYLYAPFFAAGHLVAGLSGQPQDGLSPPYQVAMLIGGLIYSLLGIWILRKVLLRYFSDFRTAVTLALVIFGTNYIYDAAFKGAMPHNLLFTVYAFLLWFTVKYHESRKFRYVILIGFTCGILILSRPSEIVCLFIPLLWGVTGKASFLERLRGWRQNLRPLLTGAACILLVWLPQLIYWKSITGNFLYYSYDNPGEGFDFLTPYIWQVLFSFRKGWLVYTPVMAASIAGLYFLYRQRKDMFWPVTLFFLFNLYIVSSWSCWWYAESYGQRALIQSYAVMALPLGYFAGYVLDHRKRWLKKAFLLLALILIALNGFQIWQLRHGVLDASRMTRAYYFSVFGKTSVTEEQKKKLIIQRPSTSREYFTGEDSYNRREEGMLDFEDRSADMGGRQKQYDSTVVFSGKYSFRLDSNWSYSPGFDRKFREVVSSDHAWIRASVNIFPTADIKANDALLVVTFDHKGRYYKYRGVRASEAGFDVRPGQWNRITMDYITPEVRSRRDGISIYVWYQGKAPLYVDDLKVEVFEEK